MTTSVSVSVTMLVTTPENVSEKARCAPITSLPSLLTSAPVRVRVKNATGIRCTWSNTAVRRSRIRPSPIVDDSQRVTSETAGLGDGDRRDHRGQRHDDAERAACRSRRRPCPRAAAWRAPSSALTTLTADEHAQPAVMPCGEAPDPAQQLCGRPATAGRRPWRASAGTGSVALPFQSS